MDLDKIPDEDLRKSGEGRVVPLPPISPQAAPSARESDEITNNKERTDLQFMPSASEQEVATNAMDRSQERPLLGAKAANEKEASAVNKVAPTSPATEAQGKPQATGAPKSNRKQLVYEDDNSQEDEEEEQAQIEDPEDDGVTYISTSGEVQRYTPNPKFKHYKDLFQDLLKQKNILTINPIVSMVITNDSTKAITVTKMNNKTYFVRQFDLETYEETFNEEIGGREKDFIKLKEIEQNDRGDQFALAYNNDGKFYVRTFGKQIRSPDEIKDKEIDVNELLGLDNNTMCNGAYPDPFMNVIFIDDATLYVCLFHNASSTHWHFKYDLNQKSIIGEAVKYELPGSKKNFPQKSFYNDDTKEIYTIYRDSQNFIIPVDDLANYQYDHEIVEDTTDLALGQMYLIFNKALVVSASNEILFFKIRTDPDTERREWYQYYSIQERGQIYFIKGNVRIQIVTEEKIYFYIIDQEEQEPILENVMFNYMRCSQMMFGPKVRYCITYKNNQKSFDVYRRKYLHDFTVQPISKQNLEGAFGVEMSTLNSFIIARVDENRGAEIKFYNSSTFQPRDDLSLPIRLYESGTREPNQIIAIESCQNEIYVAVITGKKLIMNEQKTNQLYIFRKVTEKDSEYDKTLTIDGERKSEFQFVQHRHIELVNLELFKSGICVNFEFVKEKGEYRDKLFFCKRGLIFTLDFNTSEIRTIYKFKQKLVRQPLQFVLNEQQNVFMLTTPEEGVIVDIQQDRELSFLAGDHMKGRECINLITSVAYDSEDQYFYVMCNMLDEKLGFFVLKIHSKPPYKTVFLIKWRNKLNIGDSSMYVLNNEARGYKELIMGFKSIYTNTYNIFCIDISQEDHDSIIFRHESFQLWESDCMGFLLDNDTNDFVILNKSGMSVTSFGTTEETRVAWLDDDKDQHAKCFKDKRVIVDDCGQELMLHSIESCNYMQLEKENYLQFNCLDQSPAKERLLQIRQEYVKNFGKKEEEEMGEWTLYNVNLQQPTLRELLVFQSIYVSEYLSDITEMVQDQPTPQIFFKSALELNFSNMVSILSFDSRSMQCLLHDDNEEYFKGNKYPLFYKNKIQKGPQRKGKYFYRSAIDNALRNNQKSAVEEILRYIINHQDDFVSSWLFHHNVPKLLKTGIKLEALLDSRVFNFEFELDEWPSSHPCDEAATRPYNLSIFQIRRHYAAIFPEPRFAIQDMAELLDADGFAAADSKKAHKVKYSINLLPILGTHFLVEADPASGKPGKPALKKDDVYILEECADSDEIEMFHCQNLQDMIAYKWDTYGFKFHLIGTTIHLSYLVVLFLYTYDEYIQAREERNHNQSFIILAFVSYPFVLESIQAGKSGFLSYISEFGNFLDVLFIWGSIAMAVIHYLYGPLTFVSKLLMVIVLLSAIRRTFNFLRIFRDFSTIVTMLSQVIFQLRIFMTFFLILCLLFSLMFGVLGIGNAAIPGDFKEVFEDPDNPGKLSREAPNAEFRQVGMFMGNFIQTIRVATGDFAIIDSAVFIKEREESIIFWIIWFFTVLVACVIFLNFIVAEASESYNEVSEYIEEYIQQQTSVLVGEAEEILPNCLKSKDSFPKYILLRRIET